MPDGPPIEFDPMVPEGEDPPPAVLPDHETDGEPDDLGGPPPEDSGNQTDDDLSEDAT